MCTYVAHCISGGIHEYYSRVEIDKRLPGCEYGQCGLLLESACECLVSYDVIIAEHDGQGWIRVFACPSRTSAKHLAAWGKRYGLSYMRLIDLCYRRKEYNVITQEERVATYDTNLPLVNVGHKIEKP